jgi:serralysin
MAFPPEAGGSLTAGDPPAALWRGGVRVAAVDRDDGVAEVLAAAGREEPPRVRRFVGQGIAALDEFFAYDPGFRGGVFVAGG